MSMTVVNPTRIAAWLSVPRSGVQAKRQSTVNRTYAQIWLSILTGVDG
jgi:hypothetical protein